MKQRIIIYVLGILSGLIIWILYSWTTRHSSYVILPSAYKIKGDMGILKKGMKLKVDEGFGEGFTRYILYLNIRDSEPIELDSTKSKNEIKPYWLEAIENNE